MEQNKNISYTSSGIPKIIHQVWINDTFLGNPKKDVPEKWKKSQKEWKHHHPDWIYILWTDDLLLSYLELYHPDYLDLYKNYDYLIQRADMIRYFILYDYGGVYCDLDLYPLKNIENFILGNLDHFVYEAGPNDSIVNAFMISPGKTELMKEIYSNLNTKLPWFCIGKHLKVMYSTGPNFLYKSLLNSTKPYIIIPRKLFYPYSSSEDKMICEDQCKNAVIYPIKNTSGSWHSFDSIISSFIIKYKSLFIIIGILTILFIIIGLIYYIIKYRRCKESKDKCEQMCMA